MNNDYNHTVSPNMYADSNENGSQNSNPKPNQNPNPNVNPKKMKACKTCGAQIAKSAKRCPYCGAKNKKTIYKRVWFWILIVIIIFAILPDADQNTTTSSTGKTTVNTSVKDEKDAEQSTPSVNDNSHTVYQLGDTVTADDIEITISQIELYKDTSSLFKPSDGTEVYRIYMEVKNIGKNDMYVTVPDCYADDVVCEQYYWTDNTFSWDKISAGRKNVGWVYYEVPIGAEHIEIEYETNSWTDDYIIFQVK